MHTRNTVTTSLLILSAITLLNLSFSASLRGAEEPPAPAEQARTLQTLYGSMTSLAFDFEQVTRTGNRERKGSGNAVFYKAGIAPSPSADTNSSPAPASVMRWNYTEPDRQVIINDGVTLLIYTESDRQLIKTPAHEIESDITYAFFAGTRDLLDDFEARAADSRFIFSNADTLHSLLLVPRIPHNQIREVRIWFDDRGIIHHMVIEDHFDSVTELHFNGIRLNSLPPGDRQEIDRITSFPVPPGTEIITR